MSEVLSVADVDRDGCADILADSLVCRGLVVTGRDTLLCGTLEQMAKEDAHAGDDVAVTCQVNGTAP